MVYLPVVGNLISAARKHARASQFDMAARAGWTQQVWSVLERGGVTNLRTVLEAARLVGIAESVVLTELAKELPNIRTTNHRQLASDIERALSEHHQAVA